MVKIDWSGTTWSATTQPLKSAPLLAVATRPVPWRMARAIVRYRVYCVILAVPDCPSFLRASRRGITTVSNCRMMLAVMYGMMPSAKMVICSSAPPLNMLTRPNRLLLPSLACLTHCWTAS